MYNVIIIAVIITLSLGGKAVAAEREDVIASVNQFVEGFNKGDMKMLTASCADEASIIDEFAPYEWHGQGACAKWANDYQTDAEKNGISDGVATLRKQSHVDIAGDRAYVVGPANYSYKQKGKIVNEVGSIFTVVLEKTGKGWKIIGWSWAKG